MCSCFHATSNRDFFSFTFSCLTFLSSCSWSHYFLSRWPGERRKESLFSCGTRHAIQKMDQQNLHLLITGAIIWARYEAKIIELNGTFACNVSLIVSRLTSCTDDALPSVYIKRRQGHIWSTYHDILTFVMHGAAGDGSWFSPQTNPTSVHL